MRNPRSACIPNDKLQPWVDKLGHVSDANAWLKWIRINPIRPPTGQLTYREREIVQLVVQGFSHQDIATALFITKQGVMNHMTRIYKKTGVDSTLGLFLHAIRGCY